MVKLDLTGNKVCDVADYRSSVFEAFPKLEALDGTDKNDLPVESEDDSEEDLYGDEDGEFENDELLGQLDEDTRKRLLEGNMTAEELEALGIGGENDFLPEEFGEDELDEEAEEGDDAAE